MRRMQVAVAGLAVLVVAGCGGVRPGLAMSVGDESVSMDDLDAAVVGQCALQVAQVPAYSGAGAISGGDVSRATLLLQAQQIAADAIVDERGLVVPAPRWTVTSDVRDQISQANPDVDVDEVAEGLEAQLRVTAAEEVIGADERGTDPADLGSTLQDPIDDKLVAAGTAAIQDYLDDVGVDLDPRFGEFTADGTIEADAAADPLSQPDDGTDASPVPGDDLPADARCEA